MRKIPLTPIRLAHYIAAVLVAIAPLAELLHKMALGVTINWQIYLAVTVTFWFVFSLLEHSIIMYQVYTVNRK